MPSEVKRPMAPVFQSSLPYDPALRPLPGIQPMEMQAWLHVDDAFEGQMAERDWLLATKRDKVVALHPDATEAADELLDLVLSLAYPGAGETVRRADGQDVAIDRSDPMGTLGHLVQEDLILLQKRGEEHHLTAAVLCFPASWTLAEKFDRPLGAIHTPVQPYDEKMAKRVQRLFDGVQPDRPLWRHNALWYETAELFHPKPEAVHKEEPRRTRGQFFRSERQCIVRLPRTQAVVFSVHTYVIPADRIQAPSDGKS